MDALPVSPRLAPPGDCSSDALTGLLDRAGVIDSLEHHLAHAGEGFCVLRLDIDGFAHLGARPSGDRLLRAAGAVLRDVLPSDAPLGRVGADVFVAVLPGLDCRETQRLAGRLQRALGEPLPGGAGHAGITAGIGLAVAPEHGRDPERLLRASELALLAAKDAGAGQLAVYEEGLWERAEHLGLVRAALWAAVHQEQIRLDFQPIVDLRTGRTAGFEALARWKDPELGSVGPDDFLPVATRCGLLAQLERQLVRRALDELARWPAGPWLAVNLSPEAVADPTLVDRLELLMGERGIDGRRLHIEVTETSMIRSAEATQLALEGIRGLGSKVYLDDFGTGFSSLGHLDAFPLDGIKIDRSFIGRLNEGGRTRRIVEATLSLAQSLELDVVAEGIETVDQLEVLTARGCPLGQGWLYSTAVRSDEALGLFGSVWPTARAA